jgi:hypothetical protein
MSLEDASMVLQNLSEVLIIAYPLILIFFWLPVLLRKKYKPISSIIETSNITKWAPRIPLPQNRDELYVLSKTINNLLDRIENTIEREKNSRLMLHMNWRTPLTIIKGTLEVLIRKPRNSSEEKINFCIYEVDRLNNSGSFIACEIRKSQSLKKEKIYLNTVIDSISRYSNIIQTKTYKL